MSTPFGITTRFDYDALNRLIKTTDPLSQTLATTYDANGNPVTQTDKRGIVTTSTYDAFNRVVKVEKDGITLTRNEFDGVGNLIAVTDANRNRTDYVYDHLNQVIEERAPLNATTLTAYNAGGQRIQLTDPENRITAFQPDARGRVLSQTYQGLTTQFSYDGNGNLLTQTKPLGNTWQSAYDGANRLVSLTSPTGLTQYAYDKNDNRVEQTDALNQVTRFTYDENDLLVAMTYPDASEATYTYDPSGNLTAATYPNGTSMSAVYDELNRVTEHRYSDGTRLTYTYDPNNNLTASRTDETIGTLGSRSSDYDAFDRETRVTDFYGLSLTYTYDANGNRLSVTSDGGTSSYTYDALNRVATVSEPNGETRYSYDASGLLTQVVYPSNLVADYSYDAQGRVAGIHNQTNGATLSSYEYSYDDNGNRTRQVEVNGGDAQTTDYAYDSEDRLTDVTYPDTQVAYTYDANFNRLTEHTTRIADHQLIRDWVYDYNHRNELTAITDRLDAANSIAYRYDANGNQIEKVKGSEVSQFTYDARNQLRQVAIGGTEVGRFVYDHRGLRVEKQGERGIERNTYDGDSLLLQSDSSGNLLAHYRYGAFRLLSLTESGKDSEYYVFDSLGSPVNLTTLGGDVTARYQYDAWGHKRLDASTSWNRISFTGHEEDTETGLIYAKARFYDPDTGRFLTQDPWEGDISIAPSLHKYLYAYANPTVYLDPDGNEPKIYRQVDESGNVTFTDRPQSLPTNTDDQRIQQRIQEDQRLVANNPLARKDCNTPNCVESSAALKAEVDETFGSNRIAKEDDSSAGATIEDEADVKRSSYITEEGKQVLHTAGEIADTGSSALNPLKAAHDTYQMAKEISSEDIQEGIQAIKDNPGKAAAAIILGVASKGKVVRSGVPENISKMMKSQKVAPDLLDKGVHFNVQKIELRAVPDHKGGIVFKSVHPGMAAKNPEAFEKAVREANAAIQTPEFRAWLSKHAEKGFQIAKQEGSGKALEFKMLQKALERMGQ